MTSREYKPDVENRFTYHPPRSEGEVEKYELLRKAGKWLALDILKHTPESREQSLALTKVEEAVMWANAAIARNPPRPDNEE
jgi:hypothetical protein